MTNKIILLLFLIIINIVWFLAFIPGKTFAIWIKEQNPILDLGTPGSWDDETIGSSSVYYNGIRFDIWYEGHDGQNLRIGHASSTDGKTWNKSPNYVIDILSDPNNQNVHNPHVLVDANNNYKMWYAASSISFFNIHINYTTSNDGLVWSPSTVNIMSASLPWESNRGISFPRVLISDNQYKMWYAGNSIFNGNDTWNIGYASSVDGSTWIKNSNPLLIDSANPANPHVIFENNIYHMFYHTDFGVRHATSYDGINWTKDPANPILTPGPMSFDSARVLNPFVVNVNGAYYMYYSGRGSDGKFRIGLAINNNPLPTPLLSPTPTPTPKVDKVIVIPGLGASWNADAILNCKSSDYTGDWILAPYAEDVYNPILNALSQTEYTPHLFPYDWRKVATSSAMVFKDEINENTSEFEKVHAVGHSLGGLVGRAYIEQATSSNKLQKFMTVGSPHQGTPLAYPAWSGGDLWQDNFLQKLAMTILLKRCGGLFGNDRETIQSQIPSIQNLLPTFNYLRDKKTGLLKPESDMIVQNNWLPNGNFMPPYYDTIVGALSGTGVNTLNFIPVQNPSKHDVSLGNFLDGKPTGKEFSKEGDGTILTSSSMIPDTYDKVISDNHTGLIANESGISEILDFLGISNSNLSTQSQEEPTSAIIIIGYPSTFWITDPSGKIIKEKQSLVSILNPKSGNYRLVLLPQTDNTLFIVGQFLEDGQVLWKEYNLTNRLPKIKTIKFDKDHPQEDAFK